MYLDTSKLNGYEFYPQTKIEQGLDEFIRSIK
jgi:hypothetical protein